MFEAKPDRDTLLIMYIELAPHGAPLAGTLSTDEMHTAVCDLLDPPRYCLTHRCMHNSEDADFDCR